MRQLVQAVNKKRSDAHWYLVAPEKCKGLMKDTERVTILPYKFTSWAVQNRFHFDFVSFKKILGMEMDIDIIFNSQPELTGNLFTVFNPPGRDMRFAIPIVSYLHWLSVPETPKYQESCFQRQVEGMLYSKSTGINSLWAKKIFLRHLRERVEINPMITNKAVTYIEKTLNPLTLGVPLSEIDSYRKLEYDELASTSEERALFKRIFEQVESKKTIVFNHRLMVYTGAELFMKFMKKLGETRKDFLVWLTDPNYKAFFEGSKLDMLPNMLRISGLPWKVYIALLSRSYFSTACHPTYSAWSLSCVDTMSVGRPVLVPNAFAFPEIVGKDYEMKFSNDEKQKQGAFVEKATQLLEDEKKAKKIGEECRKRVEDYFNWDKVVDSWLKVLDSVCTLDYGDKTESMSKLEILVKKGAMMSKQQIFDGMKWSYDFNTKVTWQRYRNFLLSNGFQDDPKTSKVFFSPKIGGQSKLEKTKSKTRLSIELESPKIELESHKVEVELA